jgi:NAD(P)-dependent dehydrogenase (short-subunit alcohol dehydrogenase family)
METLAAEVGNYGIRCNTMAPGTIATQRNWKRLTTEQRVDRYYIFYSTWKGRQAIS